MAETHIVIVSASQATKSRSRLAAQAMQTALEAQSATVDFIDLSNHDLPHYPHGRGSDTLQTLMDRFEAADAWVFASPIYNWEVTGTMRNFLHYVAGRSKRRYRPFAIIIAAGGEKGFLAADGLSRTIIYEDHAVQIGPAILVTGQTVDRDAGTVSEIIEGRLKALAQVLVHYATASTGLINPVNS